MARPSSHHAVYAYDPYSYYAHAIDDAFYPSHSSTCHNSLSLSPLDQSRPASFCSVHSRRSRPASIWSTSSVCSDDSSFDNGAQENETAGEVEEVSVAEDAQAEKVYDEMDNVSPISPVESIYSRASWISAESSCSSHSSIPPLTPVTPVTPSLRLYPRTSSREKPRGPRPRPLPALPVSQPTSPVSPLSPLPRSHAYTDIYSSSSALPKLKVVTPPPSYSEAIRSREVETKAKVKKEYPWNAIKPDEYLTSPVEDDLIDWDRIEAFMLGSDTR